MFYENETKRENEFPANLCTLREKPSPFRKTRIDLDIHVRKNEPVVSNKCQRRRTARDSYTTIDFFIPVNNDDPNFRDYYIISRGSAFFKRVTSALALSVLPPLFLFSLRIVFLYYFRSITTVARFFLIRV